MFIFDYDKDLARAKRIYELAQVVATAPAGFDDPALWRAAKDKGDDEVRRLIDTALDGTSVTVVLIGERTAELDYVTYAIKQSVRRNDGLLGLFVHGMKDENGKTGPKGAVPFEAEARKALPAGRYATHDWDPDKLAEWVEDAATEWRAYARPEPLNR